MDRHEMFKKERIGKLVLKFSIPAIAAMAVSALYNVIDRIFVGQGVGAEALSGIAVTAPMMMILTAFALLCAAGTSVLVSIKLGEGNAAEAEHTIGNAFSLAMTMGLVLSLILIFFLKPILVIFGGTGIVLDYAVQFMQIITLAVIFQFTGYTLNYSIRAVGNPVMALVTIVIGAVINTILNPFFIFVLHLGVRGSALATLVSQFVTMIWTIAYFTNPRHAIRLKLRNLIPSFSIIKRILTVGLPPLFLQGMASITLSVANIVVFRYGGNNGLAVIGVLGVIYVMFQMILSGIGQGVAPIIGYNYGSNNFARVSRTVRIAMLMGTVICLVGFTGTFFFNKSIMALFTRENAELLDTGAPGLKVICLALPLMGFEIIAGGYFQAIGKYPAAIFINLLRQSLVTIPLLLLFSRFYGLKGCFAAFPATDVIAAIVIAVMLAAEWKKQKIKSAGAADIPLSPEEDLPESAESIGTDRQIKAGG